MVFNKCTFFRNGGKEKARILKEIKDGNIVEMYFAVSKGSGGENDIVYKGEVLDIKTEKKVYFPQINY